MTLDIVTPARDAQQLSRQLEIFEDYMRQQAYAKRVEQACEYADALLRMHPELRDALERDGFVELR